MKTLDELMLLADAYTDCAEVNGDKPRAALVAAIEELIAEKQREIDAVRDDAAFLIRQKLKERRDWRDSEGVPI